MRSVLIVGLLFLFEKPQYSNKTKTKVLPFLLPYDNITATLLSFFLYFKPKINFAKQFDYRVRFSYELLLFLGFKPNLESKSVTFVTRRPFYGRFCFLIIFC